MKKEIWIHQMIFTALLLFLAFDCKKDEPATIPLLSTISITDLTATSAICGGNISSDGRATITVRGVCWSTTARPTIADSKTVDGTGTGQFVSSIIGLAAGTTYHVVAYATNSVGTAYGSDISFTTLGQSPSNLTQPATNVSESGATLNGTVNANGLSTTVTFEYGTTTSYGSAVTASQSPVTGDSINNVSADISGLTEGTNYHFRIKTVNSLGTTYGDDMSFIILGQAPLCSTQPTTNIFASGATLNGTVNANNLSTTVTFEYGTTTSYGNTATAYQSPVTGNSNVNVSAYISNLVVGTTYHFRLKVENSQGVVYGSDIEFYTTQEATAFINEVTNLNPTSVTLNGAVDGYGLSTIVIFEYGTTTSYGSTASVTQGSITSNEFTDVRANISGLTAGTTYHVRVTADNSYGTVYGNDMEFTTPNQSAPTATTWSVTNLTSTSATLNGSVNSLGLSTGVTFEYDTTSSIYDIPTSYGNSISAIQSPITEDGITNVSADISGLTPCTIYHFRVKAENSLGVLYGSDQHFYKVRIPTLMTSQVSGITATTAIVEGIIINDGGAAVTQWGVEYWLSANHTGRGHTVIKNQGTVTGSFSCNLSGLRPNTSYCVRAMANNCLFSKFIGVQNWAEGNRIIFTTSP